MGLTTFDVSPFTIKTYKAARAAWDASGGDWRDFRKLCVLYAEEVFGCRENGTGVVPFVARHPNIGDDSIDESNFRWVEQNIEGTTVHYIRHWATPFEVIEIPLTQRNCSELSKVMSGLNNYPIICEHTCSEVETEMIDESIGAYAASDLLMELRDSFPVHSCAVEGHVISSLDEWSRTTGQSPEVVGRDVRWPDADQVLADLVNDAATEEHGEEQ